MIEITQKTFDFAYSIFKNVVEKDSEKLTDFKSNEFVNEHENYKYAVLQQAKESLLTKTWKQNEIGSGKILNSVKKSIQTNVIFNFKTHQNNLIDWRKKDDFYKLKANHSNEKLFFDFFKNNIKSENAFNQFIEFGFSYQLIAYLFFIHNPQKFLPISQSQFDLIFNSLNIDLKTNHNLSWENYEQYNQVIKQFQYYLKAKFDNFELLDAHSFLWIYGFHFGQNTKTEEKRHIGNETKKNTPQEKTIPILDTYEPKRNVDFDTIQEPIKEIDFVEQLKKQIEVGTLAETVVLQSEIDFLNIDYPELAKKVRSVANNPKLGFDILSFETDGTQKQIEVKAIAISTSKKRFFISQNEFQKSKKYANYYIYCVTELDSDAPKILRIKNPDLEDKEQFTLEPITYQVTFE